MLGLQSIAVLTRNCTAVNWSFKPEGSGGAEGLLGGSVNGIEEIAWFALFCAVYVAFM